ncbi:TetR/AcrR family transcriptional regulator [Polaribacter sargassicola]|uniref:TetR/AcrR family transcriptional regulator n=1 Tax=Polaribacter sargassicola TaxID=2836891 RepID=UPI001F3254FD|nr:TetR/AcrR family transcriptional regulator [Polaribacter sp. DS7-9]MCG1035117.1 TetR/AcrR family transcriptional regulator [Polaribacter sp. DS7-9]
MITKAELLKYSITKFSQHGGKHVTLDDLAKELSISKKTIYSLFKNKEDLITSGVESLINNYKKDIHKIISTHTDTILCVMLIYKAGFEYLKYLKPSFLFSLQKYYPKADLLFNNFIEELSYKVIYNLLIKAKKEKNIRPEVNIELIIKIYFFRIDKILFKENNLFEFYSQEEIFKHLIVYNLKGITNSNYNNSFFD